METYNPVSEFMTIFESIFSDKISAKTGWGKNEIMQQFEKAKAETAMKLFEKSLVK